MTPRETPPDFEVALRRFHAEAIHRTQITPRYRCRYFLWGAGPPLVFVHGLGDRSESFVAVMARLVNQFTCIGFELADGLGDGARLGAYRHRHHIEDLVLILNHAGFDSVDVLGSSYGTTITLRALTTHPNRFRRAVLQGGFARRPLRWFERGPARVCRYWPGRIADVPGRDAVLSRLDRDTFAETPRRAYQHFLHCTGRTPIRALTRRALIVDRLDLRPILPDIPHPVLLIQGDNDRVVPQPYQAELERGLPNASRVGIARCGHYPQYTHPDRMADVVRAFLLT